MAYIKPAKTFSGLDLAAQAKNFVTLSSGDEVRQPCYASAVQALATATNHLAARHPRVIFCQGQDETSTYDSNTATTLYQWTYDDIVDNARAYTYRLLTLPRTTEGTQTAGGYCSNSLLVSRSDGATTSPDAFTSSGAEFEGSNVAPGDILVISDTGTAGDNGHYIIKTVDSATALTIHGSWPAGSLSSLSYDIYSAGIAGQGGTSAASTASYPEDLVYREFTYLRGTKDGSEITEGLDVRDGFRVCDLVVQDALIDQLETDLHQAVAGMPQAGHDVLDVAPASIASTFHTLRTTNLPIVVSWAATDCLAGNTPGSSDETGFAIPVGSVRNIFDLSSTSRSASTPGVLAYMYAAGRGCTAKANNLRVKVQCRVLAATAAAVGSTHAVEFHGPDAFASNSTSISVTDTLQWYGASDNYIYLNAEALDTWATTAANKIDILAGGEEQTIYIYGLMAWVEYA